MHGHLGQKNGMYVCVSVYKDFNDEVQVHLSPRTARGFSGELCCIIVLYIGWWPEYNQETKDAFYNVVDASMGEIPHSRAAIRRSAPNDAWCIKGEYLFGRGRV